VAYAFLMCDVRDESSVSKVLMGRIVLDVRVAICKYAERRAGERAGTGCESGWLGIWVAI
jgi:hypothetical protein